jgi:hypothetical protein
MLPLTKKHMESHFAIVRLKELPIGFKVELAEAVWVDDLSGDDWDKYIHNLVLINQTNRI